MPVKNIDLPPVKVLRELLDYRPATGKFFWRARSVEHFSDEAHCAAWNKKFAGVETFTQDRKGYLAGEFLWRGQRYRPAAARLAYYLMTGDQPETIDHINGDKKDNRACNLRAATYREQQYNRCVRKDKKVQLPKGVFLEGSRFVARSWSDGAKRHLGRFDTPGEAHKAYCDFVKPIHGEFFNPGDTLFS